MAKEGKNYTMVKDATDTAVLTYSVLYFVAKR